MENIFLNFGLQQVLLIYTLAVSVNYHELNCAKASGSERLQNGVLTTFFKGILKNLTTDITWNKIDYQLASFNPQNKVIPAGQFFQIFSTTVPPFLGNQTKHYRFY